MTGAQCAGKRAGPRLLTWYARPVKLASGTVLLIDARTQVSHAVKSDLALAGFEVLSVADPRTLFDKARGRPVAALVLPEAGIGASFWRRWTRDSDLRHVPVVVVSARRPGFPLLPWPFCAFVRADAYVSTKDLKRSGAVAEAVSASHGRADGVAPTSRERLGEALWYVGSVVYDLGLLLVLVAIVQLAMMRAPVAILLSVVGLGTGKVLMDVGGSLGISERLRLHWSSWAWVAFVLLATRFLCVHG